MLTSPTFWQTLNPRAMGSRFRVFGASCLGLGVCWLSFVLVGCGGKNTTPSTPAAPTLATATFGPGGGASVTVPLSFAQQNTLAQLLSFNVPTCTLHSGSAPMVFTAGASSTWFGVTPQAGNLQPNGTTSIGISTIIWSNVAIGGQNNGFVIVSASGGDTVSRMCLF